MCEIPITKGYSTIVDEDDYHFLMKWKWHACLSGDRVYAMRNSKTKNGKRHHIMMHRIINKTPDGMDTDHINGNGLDNRRSNLRNATRTQNQWNRRENKKGASKYKGVYWHKQHRKWIASIQVGKIRFHLGLFINELDAANAYAERAETEFGDFNREIYYG